MGLNLSALLEVKKRVSETITPFFVPPPRVELLSQIREEEEMKKRQARVSVGLPALPQEELRMPSGKTTKNILDTVTPEEMKKIVAKEIEYMGVRGVTPQGKETFTSIPFLGGTIKKVAKGLEPIIEKLKGMDKPTFLRQFDEGLKGQNLTTRQTAQNIEALIKKSGFKDIGDFYDAYAINTTALKPKEVNTSALKPSVAPEIGKYKIATQKGISEVEGTPIKIHKDIKTFLHKDENGNWVVSEASTGRMLSGGGYPIQKHAIEDAQNLIETTGIQNIKKEINSLGKIDTAPKLAKDISQAKASGQSFDDWVKGQATLKHRSVQPIDEFKPNEKGIYFTKDAYGERLGLTGGKGDVHITDAYVDLKNPFIANKKNVTKLYQENYGLELKDAQRLADDFEMADTTARQQVRAFIKDKHDGMIIPEDWDGGFGTIESVVAFDPKQIKTRSQLKAEWDEVSKKITQEIPTTKSVLPQEIPQKIVRPSKEAPISPEKSVFPRKSSFEDTIQVGDKKVKVNVGTPEEKLKAITEETDSIKDILNRSEMRIRTTTAIGKPKTSRDLAQEITDNIKKQNETLKDPEIAKLREQNLLGAETIDEIILRKRGIITDKEAIERAKGIRGTIDDVLNLPKGAVPTKEQLTAVSQIVQGERELNLKLVQLIDGKGIAQTVDERALIAKLGKGFEGLDQHELLNKALAESTLKLKKAEIVLLGMRGEIGRSLQATKQVVEAVDSRMRILFGKIKKLNATEQQAFLEKLAKEDVKDDKKFVRFLEELNTADFFDKFAEYSTAAKLWNPTTHAVNLGGNTIRQFADIAITSIVSPRTVMSDVAGMRVGLKQGLKNALRALTDEGYASQLSKYIEEGGTAPAIGGKLGQWVRTPFRMLGAGDEVFRAIGFQRSLYRQAYTLARKEGLRGKELEKRMEAFLKNPTIDMLGSATEQAKRLTFQEDMGEMTSKINDFRTPANFTSKTGKSISLLLRFFLPFLKTPTNLLKQAVDFSPLGGVKNFTKIKEAAKAGDTETVGRLIGESVMGSALTAYIIMETLDGNITGGAPQNKAEKDRFYREKKLPYAVKIGDTWYQYKRVDPFSTVIGLVSDATTLAGQEDISTASLVNTLINQMSDKTYLAGINDFMNLLTGEAWEREYALKSMVLGASLPSFIGHTARSIDPTVRKTDTLVDRIKSQTPFVSKSLPVQVNVLGEDIERANKGLNYFFNPIQSEIAEIDPITKHLMDIDKTIPLPQDYFSRGGVKYELDAKTYSRYAKEVGTKVKDGIEKLMRTPSYQNLSEERKSDEIDKLRKDIADEWKDDYVGIKSSKTGAKSLESIFSGKKSLEEIFK